MNIYNGIRDGKVMHQHSHAVTTELMAGLFRKGNIWGGDEIRCKCIWKFTFSRRLFIWFYFLLLYYCHQKCLLSRCEFSFFHIFYAVKILERIKIIMCPVSVAVYNIQRNSPFKSPGWLVCPVLYAVGVACYYSRYECH